MIIFILHAYEEPVEQILQAIESLRTFYPDDPFYLLWDAPPEETNYKAKMEEIEPYPITQILCKERLKPLSFGGAWTHRFLELALAEAQRNSKISHILRIDPESLFLRKIEDKLPDRGIFSNLVTKNRVCLHGGAVGFCLDAARKLVDSKGLLDRKFKALKYSYTANKEYFKNTHISCQDAIVYDLALELSIRIHNFKEFSCYQDFQSYKIDRSKAIIHPVSLNA